MQSSWVLCWAAAVLAACAPQAHEAPSSLRVSAIPDQSWEKVLAQHGRTVEAVCAGAKLTCSWVQVASYEELVERIGRGDIDLAYFGGVTFAQASARHGVVPVAMRDIDAAFNSVVVVRVDDPARSLRDLTGRPFAFGAQSSTSGHVMARHFLQLQGVVPEREFSSVVYSGNHNATLDLIARGKVAAGAVNGSVAYREIARKGGSQGVSRANLRVLWHTPPYIDYVWGLRAPLATSLRQRLRDAFLDLTPANPAHREALERQSAGGYLPVEDAEFAPIVAVLTERGAL